MNTALKLIQSIETRQSPIGIIGLGYVGIPLSICFLEAGFQVLGFDQDQEKVASINKGRSCLSHIDDSLMGSYVTSRKFSATTDMQRLNEPDVVLICVPTPTTTDHKPNLSHLIESVKHIANSLRKGQLICLESTPYPGATEELLLPSLQTEEIIVGSDFFLAFSPEREDPGNTQYQIASIPKIVSGTTDACLKVAESLYSGVFNKVFPVSSTQTAECTKLIENIYRHVNISFVNELKQILSQMEVDIWEVLEAASTKPFGFQSFSPGPGIGGHCIPNNPIYFSWKVNQLGMSSQIINSALSVEKSMAGYVCETAKRALTNQKKKLANSNILILGVTYKPDIQDTRESPALPIIKLLQESGATVEYSDPYVPILQSSQTKDRKMQSLHLTKKDLGMFDLVILITDHSSFPYQLIHEHSTLIIDTRNAFRRNNFIGDHVIQA
ncbi:MAG: UDP-N-acetyl-D-glucosamine dehydrogenase [Dehalococcoidia bacterium]|nr:UDP-N-acetyl-D-glucosamine dehydrogenase [Dehalococcoidia bacterium]|tara:strand:- start:6845 stop:8167 length:1323 start_codon:yes stop_codon:yes gene_type:complete